MLGIVLVGASSLRNYVSPGTLMLVHVSLGLSTFRIESADTSRILHRDFNSAFELGGAQPCASGPDGTRQVEQAWRPTVPEPQYPEEQLDALHARVPDL